MLEAHKLNAIDPLIYLTAVFIAIMKDLKHSDVDAISAELSLLPSRYDLISAT